MKLRLLLFALLLSVYPSIGSQRQVLRSEGFIPAVHGQTPGRGPCSGRHDFLIGSGIYDITGPAAGLGMMGYAQIAQKTAGIQSRLWARALVIESPCNGKRIAFVSAELGQLFQAVKLAVVAQLKERLPGRYDDANVILSATHDHSGPGGYSRYTLYNLTIGGFDSQNFQAIVNGISQSIIRADSDLKNGTIRIANGNLLRTTINRSPASYLLNPAAERALYPGDPADPSDTGDTDKRMTLLRFTHDDGREIGEINWFAVHGTSMHNTNRLISGDNKGYASYLFEQLKQTDYESPHTFVAAFAQANEGDVTPNICGGQDGCGRDDFESTKISGGKQFWEAITLYDNAREYISGGIDYRHAYVKMDEVAISAGYTGNGAQKTCPAAIGISMLAGAEDGPGVGWQGISCEKHKFLWFLCAGRKEECHAEKPVVVHLGLKTPPWTPNILPIQIARVGNLLIIAVPAEFTTMAGRRVLRTVMTTLASAGVQYAVIAGLSNAYAGYVTTREEYANQRYEGASTHFGPWTLAAYQQEFDKLAVAMRDGLPVDPGPYPTEPTPHLLRASKWEGKPRGKEFGDVKDEASPSYHAGQRVRVAFWAGHPRNDLKIQSSYLAVERKDAANWTVVARDRDWNTRFIWKRTLRGTVAIIEWDIPGGTTPGVYRIRHSGAFRVEGDAKQFYSGVSREFQIN